ncbi:MAG: hypothetical protein PHT12_00230 [Patescibacteria group bacterium]|nr:hypothetical protein [Patescibacteria group bacterium]
MGNPRNNRFGPLAVGMIAVMLSLAAVAACPRATSSAETTTGESAPTITNEQVVNLGTAFVEFWKIAWDKTINAAHAVNLFIRELFAEIRVTSRPAPSLPVVPMTGRPDAATTNSPPTNAAP